MVIGIYRVWSVLEEEVCYDCNNNQIKLYKLVVEYSGLETTIRFYDYIWDNRMVW